MQLDQYLGRLQSAEQSLQVACRQIATAHLKDADVVATAELFEKQSANRLQRLQPFIQRYGVAGGGESEQIRAELFKPDGSLGLLRDLSGLALMVNATHMSWTIVGQAAKALRDRELVTTVDECSNETVTELEWLETRIKAAAPQILVAVEPKAPTKATRQMASRINVRHALMERYGRGGAAIYSFLGILIAIGIAGIAALVFRQPLLFPSLGPSAYLAFETPTDAAASPRNALIGHGVALLVALAALQIFALGNHPSALVEGMTGNRLLAVVLALAVTSAILVLLDAMHPPAGATSLLVTLGLLKGVQGAVVIAVGVLIVVIAGVLINRTLGVRMPLRPLKD